MNNKWAIGITGAAPACAMAAAASGRLNNLYHQMIAALTPVPVVNGIVDLTVCSSGPVMVLAGTRTRGSWI